MANDPVTDADRMYLKAHEEAVKDENLTTKQRALRRKWNRSASRRRLKTAKEVEVIGQVKAWSDPDKCILPYGRSVIKPKRDDFLLFEQNNLDFQAAAAHRSDMFV